MSSGGPVVLVPGGPFTLPNFNGGDARRCPGVMNLLVATSDNDTGGSRIGPALGPAPDPHAEARPEDPYAVFGTRFARGRDGRRA